MASSMAKEAWMNSLLLLMAKTWLKHLQELGKDSCRAYPSDVPVAFVRQPIVVALF